MLTWATTPSTSSVSSSTGFFCGCGWKKPMDTPFFDFLTTSMLGSTNSSSRSFNCASSIRVTVSAAAWMRARTWPSRFNAASASSNRGEYNNWEHLVNQKYFHHNTTSRITRTLSRICCFKTRSDLSFAFLRFLYMSHKRKLLVRWLSTNAKNTNANKRLEVCHVPSIEVVASTRTWSSASRCAAASVCRKERGGECESLTCKLLHHSKSSHPPSADSMRFWSAALSACQ